MCFYIYVYVYVYVGCIMYYVLYLPERIYGFDITPQFLNTWKYIKETIILLINYAMYLKLLSILIIISLLAKIQLKFILINIKLNYR